MEGYRSMIRKPQGRVRKILPPPPHPWSKKTGKWGVIESKDEGTIKRGEKKNRRFTDDWEFQRAEEGSEDLEMGGR